MIIQTEKIHSVLFVAAWLFIQNVLIWAQYCKYRLCGIVVHVVAASLIVLMNLVALLLVVLENGLSVLVKDNENIREFIIMVLLILQIILGPLCRYSWSSPKSHPKIIRLLNLIHQVLGWITILIAKYTLYKKLTHLARFYFYIILIDVLSHIIYLILKFSRSTLQSQSYNEKAIRSSQQLRKIYSVKGLSLFGENYFIFANYVYSLSSLMSNHPGGRKLIEEIKTKDVDRYLYGAQPVLLYDEISARPHSFNSIKLAEVPIGQLKIPLTYKNMYPLNETKIKSLIKINPFSQLYLIYLQDTSEQKLLDYIGYTSLSQLGRYYALTYKKETRLYSAVNFLQKDNIELMEMVWGHNNVNLNFNPNDLVKNKEKNTHFVPLLIKKYQSSSFPDKYFDDYDNQFYLSQPRGLGLALGQAQSGTIVIFGGGTGINPFCDLIDLIYKNKLINQSHPLSALMMQNDPILKEQPFNRFRFKIYLAIKSVSQLHQITLLQCKQLSRENIIDLFFRISQDSGQWLAQKHPKINVIYESFETILLRQLRIPQLSKIYICGPPRMTKAMQEILFEKQVTKNKFQIL